VELGRVSAPGFLTGDPATRAAYLGALWIGPARGHIQPKQEIDAEVVAVELGVKSLDQVTAELTGSDWEETNRQRQKERRMMTDQVDGDLAIDTSLTTDPDDIDKPETDDDEPPENPDDPDSPEALRNAAETYGVATRAGVITPQPVDEEHFRTALNLPVMSEEVTASWADADHGVRRPVTLAPASMSAPTDEAGKPLAADGDAETEPGDENGTQTEEQTPPPPGDGDAETDATDDDTTGED